MTVTIYHAAWNAEHLSYDGFVDFMLHTHKTVPGFRLVTHGVHGTKDFSVWEWTLKFRATETDQIRGIEVGKETWMRGCSLHWWRLQEGGEPENLRDWKIVREGDYAKETPVKSEG